MSFPAYTHEYKTQPRLWKEYLVTSVKLAILFFAWAAISALLIVRMLMKWGKIHPDKPSLRLFHFLLRLTAFVAFLFLGIVNMIWRWN